MKATTHPIDDAIETRRRRLASIEEHRRALVSLRQALDRRSRDIVTARENVTRLKNTLAQNEGNDRWPYRDQYRQELATAAPALAELEVLQGRDESAFQDREQALATLEAEHAAELDSPAALVSLAAEHRELRGDIEKREQYVATLTARHGDAIAQGEKATATMERAEALMRKTIDPDALSKARQDRETAAALVDDSRTLAANIQGAIARERREVEALRDKQAELLRSMRFNQATAAVADIDRTAIARAYALTCQGSGLTVGEASYPQFLARVFPLPDRAVLERLVADMGAELEALLDPPTP